jgi:hypothetical protein
VIGFGERKTPRLFVAACNRFVYTELLGPEACPPAGAGPKPPRGPAAGTPAGTKR